jgi:hypothetical protein
MDGSAKKEQRTSLCRSRRDYTESPLVVDTYLAAVLGTIMQKRNAQASVQERNRTSRRYMSTHNISRCVLKLMKVV